MPSAKPKARVPKKFEGGCDTKSEITSIPNGGFSMIMNMRAGHPGFEQRGGMRRLHTVGDTDSGNATKVMSLYQFNRAKSAESHLFAQMSDGDVLKATTAPPGVTTGAFGTEVFSGSSGQIPASWANVSDMCIMANGVDQFQIYPGTLNKIRQFVVFKGSAAPPAIPTEGEDYTDQLLYNNSVAALDSLGDLATDFDCIFIRTDLPCDTFTWTVSKVNGSAAVMAQKYFNGAWTAVSNFTDNTASGGATLAQTGTTTCTLPTDHIPHLMFGAVGFWHMFYLSSGDLDSEVEVSSVTYETDWQGLINMWDGIEPDAIEAQFYDESAGTYTTFGGSAITLNGMTSSDALYVAAYDDSIALYFDFGDTPNTTASITVTVKYYNGSTWGAVSNKTDATAGFTKSGYITFSRQTDGQPQQFNSSKYYARWYQITVSDTLSATVSVGVTSMPVYNISEFGKGICVANWKGRAAYVFDLSPADITVTPVNQPLVLSGTNSDVLKIGDGRQNKIVFMRQFNNELLIIQEELGEEGGGVTMYEGYSPDTFGPLASSTRLGTFSAKSADLIEGVMFNNRVTLVAVALSHSGVWMFDGKGFAFIHDLPGKNSSIANYFDPRKTECIRRGYEKEMWLKHDKSCNVLRLGLVSGASATVPNVFPVLDLNTGVWSFDDPTPDITCMTEASAGSGNVSIVQIGGSNDGFIYQHNYGVNDVAADGSSTAIDAYAKMELDVGGDRFNLDSFTLRLKKQTAGSCTITAYQDNVARATAYAIDMTASDARTVIRKLQPTKLEGNHVSLKFQNNVVDQGLTLLDVITDERVSEEQ